MAFQVKGEFGNQVAEVLAALEAARLEEKAAKAKREALELQVTTMLGVPDTWAGSKTFVVGGQWKMVAKRSMNFRVDEEAFQSIRAQHTELADRLFRAKVEVNKTAWRDAEQNEKNIFAAAVISAPGKVSVTAEKI